ncbi:Protein Virilizer-like [Manis pentadactyla]|nr:Protein Virilizer-like [Manis pentadactyla]
MIKISFSPAPSRARRRPGRRVAGRRGAGDWAARARGPRRTAPGRVLAEAPEERRGNRERRAGIAQRKEGKQRVFVAERGRRGRAELIATLILCPAAQPSPEPGVAARSRSRSPRWEGGERWERREGSRRAARRGGGGGGSGREEGRRRGEGGEGRPRRAAPRGAARSGGRGGRGGRVGGESESNSRTRPERPALRAQAARLRPAPETGGCRGRGLRPSRICRSGSEEWSRGKGRCPAQMRLSEAAQEVRFEAKSLGLPMILWAAMEA